MAVTRAHLTNDVIFAGDQHDLVPWLSSADLFLLPSSQESFGMAALEAMACEVPVVASRVGGLPEIIESGDTGFLCEPDDVDDMVQRSLACCAIRRSRRVWVRPPRQRSRAFLRGACGADVTRSCTRTMPQPLEVQVESDGSPGVKSHGSSLTDQRCPDGQPLAEYSPSTTTTRNPM